MKKRTSGSTAAQKRRGRLSLRRRRHLPSRYHRTNRNKASPYRARMPKPKKHMPQHEAKEATGASTHSFYQPLDASRQEIRLIRILPAQDNEETIRCEIETASLSTGSLEFAAISYVWGDPKVTRQISINNEPFYITENLHDAIRQFRSNTNLLSGGGNSVLPLWADAICINQGDVNERNQQVPFMSVIYGSAALVISWLGVPGVGKEDDAVLALKAIAAAAFEDKSEEINEGSLLSFTERYLLHEANATWVAIRNLFLRPYWERIWIVQEIILVKATSMHLCICGDECIKFEELVKSSQAVEFLKTNNDPRFFGITFSNPFEVRHVDGLSTILQIADLRKLYRESHSIAAFSAFILSLNHRATDAKDMVYGLQAVICSKIIVDYNKPMKEIYLDWYNAVIDDRHAIESCATLLNCTGLASHRLGESNLPSWLPELRVLFGLRFPFGERDFNQRHLESFPFQKPSVQNGVLHMSGVRFCGRIVQEFGPVGMFNERLHKLCFSVWARSNRVSYPTGISILQALFYALLRGHDRVTGHRLAVPPDPVNAFKAFHLYGCINSRLRRITERMDEKNQYQTCRDEYGPIWGLLELDTYQELESILEADICRDVVPPLPPARDSSLDIPDGIRIPGYHELRAELVACLQMAVFQTEEGYIGVGPLGLKVGDQVCNFGRGLPTLVREYDGRYVNIGGCYIYGVSDGEVADTMEPGDPRIERFEIY